MRKGLMATRAAAEERRTLGHERRASDAPRHGQVRLLLRKPARSVRPEPSMRGPDRGRGRSTGVASTSRLEACPASSGKDAACQSYRDRLVEPELCLPTLKSGTMLRLQRGITSAAPYASTRIHSHEAEEARELRNRPVLLVIEPASRSGRHPQASAVHALAGERNARRARA